MMRGLPNRRHARLSVLIALAYGVAQLGALGHMATVAHVTCSEHGESLHFDRAVAFVSEVGLDAASSVHKTADRPQAAPEHDHCSVVSYVQSRAAFLAEPPATCDGQATCLCAAPVGTSAPHDLAPRARAPKHSPPDSTC